MVSGAGGVAMASLLCRTHDGMQDRRDDWQYCARKAATAFPRYREQRVGVQAGECRRHLGLPTGPSSLCVLALARSLRRLADSSPQPVGAAVGDRRPCRFDAAFSTADAGEDKFECSIAVRLPLDITDSHNSYRMFEDKTTCHTKDLTARG